MTLYKGNAKIQDTGSYGVFKGSQPIGAIYKGNDKLYMFHRVINFYPQQSFQEYKVPVYVTKIQVDCVAASGHNQRGGNTFGGKGGRVQCYLNVTGGQTLYLWVPENPTGQTYSETLMYNAADIRTNNDGLLNNTSLQSRLIVAGGGGETYYGTNQVGAGGDGGGETADNGGSVTLGGGGKGGTQSAGGAGGSKGSGTGGGSGHQGSFGLGGTSWAGNVWRGVGGSGWYGGGSGGASTYYQDGQGGGGGGSSYINTNLCSQIPNIEIHTKGYNEGAGYITITEIE